jgi:hypothetical protein
MHVRAVAPSKSISITIQWSLQHSSGRLTFTVRTPTGDPSPLAYEYALTNEDIKLGDIVTIEGVDREFRIMAGNGGKNSNPRVVVEPVISDDGHPSKCDVSQIVSVCATANPKTFRTSFLQNYRQRQRRTPKDHFHIVSTLPNSIRFGMRFGALVQRA